MEMTSLYILPLSLISLFSILLLPVDMLISNMTSLSASNDPSPPAGLSCCSGCVAGNHPSLNPNPALVSRTLFWKSWRVSAETPLIGQPWLSKQLKSKHPGKILAYFDKYPSDMVASQRSGPGERFKPGMYFSRWEGWERRPITNAYFSVLSTAYWSFLCMAYMLLVCDW